jgi:Type III restriction enzyme, res subunit/Pretoxin HINT domain
LQTCKLIIRDEVNVKLEGLDVSVRKKLVDKFKYEVPGARYQPAVRLGRWDGKVSFFQLGGSTYINLLPEILEHLENLNYDVELEDQRDYTTKFEFDPITEDTFSDKKWPKGHTREGEPIYLRDYQPEILNKFLENRQSVQEVATGAGKTIMTAALSRSVEPYGRSIVIVPNKSLVTQTETDYVNLGLDVGVYFGDRKEYNKTHTICTWQSLNNMMKMTKSGEAEVEIGDFIEGVVCVMVDECFSGDSRVLTTTGYKAIKDIHTGDEIINYSEDTQKFKVDTVIKQHKNLTKSLSEKMYEMEFDNGSKIQVSGNHKFLTNLGWIRADELTNDHEIINKT